MWPKIVCKMFFMMQSNGKANIMLKIELKVYVLVYVIRDILHTLYILLLFSSFKKLDRGATI